eukprot:TRINITY_DN8658_c0_g1_i2.p1 TRINITY_DN8658_c0_g1~~TRINITY_DN8658_c0_g1_i2.p1  ORF type:complete len:301 (-),score=35.50 TRINITY_DN8658_c0_g1_i2:13-855(-)
MYEEQMNEALDKMPDTKKMVSMLEDSVTCGSETAAKMAEQSDQLSRIKTGTENVSADLDYGTVLLRKLGMRRRFNKALKMFNKSGPPEASRAEKEVEKKEKMKEKLYGVNHAAPEESTPGEYKSVNPSGAGIRLRSKNRGIRMMNAQGSEQPKDVPASGLDGQEGEAPSTPFTSDQLAPESRAAQVVREQDADLDRMSDLLLTMREIAIQQGKEAGMDSGSIIIIIIVELVLPSIDRDTRTQVGRCFYGRGSTAQPYRGRQRSHGVEVWQALMVQHKECI